MLKQSLNPSRLLVITWAKARLAVLAMLALVTLTSSPAFAAIYTYRLNPPAGTNWRDPGTLTINTDTGAGRAILPGNLTIQFTSQDLRRFQGSFSNFSAVLDPSSVHYTPNRKREKTAGPGQTFNLTFNNNIMTITASSYQVSSGYGSKIVPGWQRTAGVGTTVPAPDSALLLGLGLFGLFSLRRFGGRSQAMAKPRRGALVPA